MREDSLEKIGGRKRENANKLVNSSVAWRGSIQTATEDRGTAIICSSRYWSLEVEFIDPRCRIVSQGVPIDCHPATFFPPTRSRMKNKATGRKERSRRLNSWRFEKHSRGFLWYFSVGELLDQLDTSIERLGGINAVEPDGGKRRRFKCLFWPMKNSQTIRTVNEPWRRIFTPKSKKIFTRAKKNSLEKWLATTTTTIEPIDMVYGEYND